MNASKCKYCQKPIVFVELDGRKIPFDALGSEANGYRASNIAHSRTCVHMIKEREQKSCPACIIRREGLEVLIERPRCIYGDFCKLHKEAGGFVISFLGIQRTIPLDYKELQKLRREVKDRKEGAVEAERQRQEYGGGLDLFGSVNLASNSVNNG